jgi:hypothetical protein
LSRAGSAGPGRRVRVDGGERCWGGACSIPRWWGEAVRCLGTGPFRTRGQAGGVRGALRPPRFRLGSITMSTRTRWGHGDRRARIRALCPNRSRRHLIEAADMAVTDPVVDQCQESAGCGDGHAPHRGRRSRSDGAGSTSGYVASVPNGARSSTPASVPPSRHGASAWS